MAPGESANRGEKATSIGQQGRIYAKMIKYMEDDGSSLDEDVVEEMLGLSKHRKQSHMIEFTLQGSAALDASIHTFLLEIRTLHQQRLSADQIQFSSPLFTCYVILCSGQYVYHSVYIFSCSDWLIACINTLAVSMIGG
jgi:hypothetical protein